MRHRQRHVHATIVKRVREGLTDLGWVNDPVNFGTTPITLLDYEPQQAGETPALNTVSISVDHQGALNEVELGGLTQIGYTLFIDIYPESEPIGVALADDVRELIEDFTLPLLDFTQAPPVETTDWLEFENVLVERIPTATTTLDKRSWRAVKATAVCFF